MTPGVTEPDCGTWLLCAFPDALPARGFCVDKLILRSLVIPPDSEIAARAPPQDGST